MAAKKATTKKAEKSLKAVAKNAAKKATKKAAKVAAKPLVKAVAPLGAASMADVPPRGLCAIYGMQDGAAKQMGMIVDKILVASNIMRPAINFLVDGSFGWNERRLTNWITALSNDGRQLHIELYLSNGPWQRDAAGKRHSWSDGFESAQTPSDFNKRIVTSAGEKQFKKEVLDRLPNVLRAIKNAGGVTYLCPMLEDNMTAEAFDAMVDYILRYLPQSEFQYKLVRNVNGDNKDHDKSNSGGSYQKRNTNYLREKHSLKSQDVDIVTNDGDDWDRISNLEGIRDGASKRNGLFLAWTAKYQGDRNDHPSKRKYQEPSDNEIKQFIKLLRGEKL